MIIIYFIPLFVLFISLAIHVPSILRNLKEQHLFKFDKVDSLIEHFLIKGHNNGRMEIGSKTYNVLLRKYIETEDKFGLYLELPESDFNSFSIVNEFCSVNALDYKTRKGLVLIDFKKKTDLLKKAIKLLLDSSNFDYEEKLRLIRNESRPCVIRIDSESGKEVEIPPSDYVSFFKADIKKGWARKRAEMKRMRPFMKYTKWGTASCIALLLNISLLCTVVILKITLISCPQRLIAVIGYVIVFLSFWGMFFGGIGCCRKPTKRFFAWIGYIINSILFVFFFRAIVAGILKYYS